MRINDERLHRHFEALSRIGATDQQGIDRPALSAVDIQARTWLQQRIETAGLEYRMDAAGNQSALLTGRQPDGPRLLLGSHLDSVPNGGRFDGALGVLAAVEVLHTLSENNYAGDIVLEAVNFTDEEGSHVGLLGSRAMLGQLAAEDLANPFLGRRAFEAGLQRLGLNPDDLFAARRSPSQLAAYLEVHIEQGPVLAEAGDAIGIVTGIVGIRRQTFTFQGMANHAGTTPMDRRRDAGRAAATFAVSAWQTVAQAYRDCVINIGDMRYHPGSFNVVPAAVAVDLEMRAADETRLKALHQQLLAVAQAQASACDSTLACGPHEHLGPVAMDEGLQALLTQAAQELGLRYRKMASGAGHDAQSFATVCPAAMIFVPSAGGVSHCPQEFSEWQDCLNGVELLLQAVIAFSAHQ
jgi:N-carbamoyl-L-amino-acid hydrolase